jgi:Ran GTPase-activating protein (RanGAP) involved in mRNA processing and transport
VQLQTIVPTSQLVQLFQALHHNLSTLRIDMEGCGAGDQGCSAMAELLLHNKRIREVDLQLNQITDIGAISIAKALPGSGMRQLHLGNNEIGVKGIKALLEAAVQQRAKTGLKLVRDSHYYACGRHYPLSPKPETLNPKLGLKLARDSLYQHTRVWM